jgi:hypothetical protein
MRGMCWARGRLVDEKIFTVPSQGGEKKKEVIDIENTGKTREHYPTK